MLEGQLTRHSHIAGAAYSVADVMTWPWIHAGLTKLGLALDATPNLARWYMAVGARPAVLRGLVVPRLPGRDSANA